MDDRSKFYDPEETITCPYNIAHTCPRKRFAIHLIKCRKQHLEISKQMKKCEFNIQHVVPRVEYEYHLETCADRENYYMNKYKIGEEANSLPDMMEHLRIPVQTTSSNEENWDEDVRCGNILQNIQQSAQEKVVFNSYSHEPPAVRKALLLENRRKTKEKLNANDDNEFERKKFGFSQKPSSKKKDAGEASSVASSYSQKSRDSSSGSDVSFKTAFTSTVNRLQCYEEPEERKPRARGRGRSRVSCLSPTPPVKFGLGRSKLYR